MLFALGLILMTAFALWFGNVTLICLAGMACLVNLLQLYRETGRSIVRADKAKNLSLDEIAVAISTNRLMFLVMGAISAFARLLTDIDVHVISESAKSPISGITSFGWTTESLTLGMPIALGVVAYLRGCTPAIPGLTGSGVLFIRSFNFLCSFFVLICGIWGAVAFQAAARIAYLSANDFWPLSSTRQAAALALFQVQGHFFFYLLFGVAPLVWLILVAPDVLSELWHKRPTQLAGKGVMVCCWILLLTGTVAAQVGDLDPIFYGVLGWGYPTDRELYQCRSHATGQPAIISCYSQATAKWQESLDTLNTEASIKLSPENFQRYEQADKIWKAAVAQDLVSLKQKPASAMDSALVLAKETQEVTRARAIYVNSFLSQVTGPYNPPRPRTHTRRHRHASEFSR
jgi:hypothetical protein